MTPLIVIVGFLGAGKTTFLQNLVPALGAEGLKPSLLINDYQHARIDAERFRGVIDEVTTLNGDCVCCGSRDELLAALEQFEHRTGRVLLVETNGTTDSEQLLETLAFNKDLKRFTPPIQLSIIDGQRWQRRFWHNALEREQVRTATHLFISRTDIIASERLASVEKSLESLGIHAAVTDPASFAREIASLPESDHSTCCGHSHAEEHSHDHSHSEHSHDHSEHHFASCEIPLPALVEKQAFEEFLNSLPEEVLRAKGLVVFRENPGEFQIFQKVGHDAPVHLFPIEQHPLIQEPFALFIGPQLPVDFLKAQISLLK
ncbi:MAG: GTP-binding protein, partial [Spartobacteria bacterium]